MSNDQKYLLIVDYNLTRIDDVKIMVAYAKEKYHLDTILIRPNPTAMDLAITNNIIDLNPRSDSFLLDAKSALSPYENKLVAGIVFSDNAVYSGAKLLASLGLPVDSPLLAEAAFSKIYYRALEQQHKTIIQAQNIFVPKFSIIQSIEDLRKFSHQCQHGFVLKPACEGNNRGVMVLHSDDDINAAWKNIHQYVDDGVLCEELIPFDDEYSYDGIGHLRFITKKISAKGKYPVELGQIVYGNFEDENGLIERAGIVANMLTGQRHGPFHNEIRLSADKKHAAIVEPNRRPAGMKIWSLAEKVFDYNFYHLWLDNAISNKLPAYLIKSNKVAAIRMLGSPVDGYLNLPNSVNKNPSMLIDEVLAAFKDKYDFHEIKWFEFKLNKSNGDYIPHVPHDNGDFIAQLSISFEGHKVNINVILEQLHHCWTTVIDKYITRQKNKEVA